MASGIALKLPEASASEPALPVPEFLLEGDEPSAAQFPRALAPKQSLTARPHTEPEPSFEPEPQNRALPEAYGTGVLLLMPRDPRCLYAHWDLAREEQERYNRQAAGQHLSLRVYRDKAGGELATEVHVHPESQHWFVHVPQAATRYVAELGFYTPASEWRSLKLSQPAFTPTDAPAEPAPVIFARMPEQTPPFGSSSKGTQTTLQASAPVSGPA